jgi:hypothetical protein
VAQRGGRGNGAGVASSVTVIVANNLGRSASNRRTVVLTFTREPRGKAKSSASWWAAAIKACGRLRKPCRQSTCCQRHAKSIAYRLRSARGAVKPRRRREWRARLRAALGLPQCFLPARRTQHHRSPGLSPPRPNSGTGVEKIVAARFGKIEKLGSHDRANRITTDPGVAAAIAIKPCRRFDRAYVKRFPKHVACCRPPTVPRQSYRL